MCLKAVEHVLTGNLFDSFGIPPAYRAWLKKSWEIDEHTIYGRFDLAYTPGGEPKLLEYNADTPTALLEAAVIQWFWLKDTCRDADQFNSIHERLIEIWQILKPRLAGTVYFSSLRGNVEDYMTVNYVRDTAMQAGVRTEYLAVEDIAWNPARRQFVAPGGTPIGSIFKLYPWEWMLREEFGSYLPVSPTRWFEPPWKMLLSNKAILPVLWQLFPESRYLLRAEPQPFGPSYVRKPLQGREGANVTIVIDEQAVHETEGPYDGPCIYQQYCPLPRFDGNYAVLGSWIVNGYACGMGVREDEHPVTRNTSRFVPHRL
ncbi:MAG TPA: glutathionylspermidine synthase family protein, partial [Gemmataceae bacterium]|nr:glutathionylspermidine synthase family protein [Gemmataceae bacterium]